MKSTNLALLAAIAFGAAGLAGAVPAAAGERHACDVTRDGTRPQSRAACYRSCKVLRVRAYCNSWCDRHCR